MNQQTVRREFFKQRFWLSCFFAMAATFFVAFDKMSGGEYVASITTILGLWGIAAFSEYRKNHPDEKPPE